MAESSKKNAPKKRTHNKKNPKSNAKTSSSKKSQEYVLAEVAARTARKNPKAFVIAVIVILLIAAIAVCTLYFGFPAVWTNLFGKHAPADDSIPLPEGLVLGNGNLAVHYMDVGQGDGILINLPDGKDMLIDCGNGTGNNGDSEYQKKALSYIDGYLEDTDGNGVKDLDYLMLTHCDLDHVSYLDEVIDAYEVHNIFMPFVLADPTNETYAAQIQTLDKAKLVLFTDVDTISSACYAKFFIAALSEPECTITLNVDDDENTNNIILESEDARYAYTFTFYCPTKKYYKDTNLKSAERKNAISPLGILEYKDYRLVFTGDANEISEEFYADRLPASLDCDVLKVAHHGSETSSTPEFLAAVKCEYAVISCGAGNGYYHPRQDAIDRLVARNTIIYRTDTNGNIVIVIETELKFYVLHTVDQTINRQGLEAPSK